jgi:hypothetical protein
MPFLWNLMGGQMFVVVSRPSASLRK